MTIVYFPIVYRERSNIAAPTLKRWSKVCDQWLGSHPLRRYKYISAGDCRR